MRVAGHAECVLLLWVFAQPHVQPLGLRRFCSVGQGLLCQGAQIYLCRHFRCGFRCGRPLFLAGQRQQLLYQSFCTLNAGCQIRLRGFSRRFIRCFAQQLKLQLQRGKG